MNMYTEIQLFLSDNEEAHTYYTKKVFVLFGKFTCCYDYVACLFFF